VQINPDVFDSVADNALSNKKMDRQWHVLCLSSEKDEDNHQSGMVLSNQMDELAPSSATLELWSTQDRDIQKLQHEPKDLQPILNCLENGIAK